MKFASWMTREYVEMSHKKRTPEQTERKRRQEKAILKDMVSLYCQLNHKTRGHLCSACSALLNYALARTESCPFMATKSFCSKCRVHCYKPEMRGRIRDIMKFSGPRMLLHHPVQLVKHIFAK